MDLIDDMPTLRSERVGLTHSPSPKLRHLLDVHAHSNASNRIRHHWIGHTPTIQDWDLPRCTSRLVRGAIRGFLEHCGLRIHGILGEEGKPPKFETVTIRDKSISVPQNVAYFLEDSAENERLLIVVERSVIGERQVGIAARDAGRWLERLREYAMQNNFLRGESFDLSGEIVPLESISMSDVVLTPEQERTVRLHILGVPKLLEKLAAEGVRYQRGVLLEGPPGCGKSMLLRAIASQMQGVSVCLATPNQLAGHNVVEELQMLLKMTHPCVVAIEELDVFGRDRSLAQSPAMAELMQVMDGLRNIPGLLWIATTNRPEEVELALADRPGRFDRRIVFGPLVSEYRRRLIERFIQPGYLDASTLTMVVERTDGLTGAQIRELCNTIALIALDDGIDGQSISVERVNRAFDDCGFQPESFGFVNAYPSHGPVSAM
ncbi:MAG: ATP-binding protein [Phycisphaeraceae bacterium]|nr:ATP-binding protein [Phycisphaeraceae bacterium]